MNRYLDKVAGFKNFVNSAIRTGDDILGVSARRARNEADTLARMSAKNISPSQAQDIAENLSRRSLHTRVKVGLGVAGAGGLTYAGNKAVQKHRENAILKRIEQMQPEYTSN